MEELEQRFQNEQVSYTAFKTTPTLLEFQDKRVNKGHALQVFCDRHQIPLEKVMAFGDMSNDIQLLKTVGWGVALQNGSQDLKQVARDIPSFSNEEDGIRQYLETK